MFHLKKIVYSIINGLAVFEGDIILGTADEMEKRKVRPTAEIIKGNNFRWPQSVIPYVIDDKLPNKDRITDAIKHWEENTPIRFINRNDWNISAFPDYVFFQSFSENWCNSHVGRTRVGEQQCNLSDGCLKGQVIHEIGRVSLSNVSPVSACEQIRHILLKSQFPPPFWGTQYQE